MSIKDFIRASVEEKPVQAYSAFSDAIKSKLDAALDDKRKEVAHSLFNSEEQD